jgi:hypothetical protein
LAWTEGSPSLGQDLAGARLQRGGVDAPLRRLGHRGGHLGTHDAPLSRVDGPEALTMVRTPSRGWRQQ